MANTEIDSLSLNISINGLNDKDIKNLESLSNSIAKLQRSIAKLELEKLKEIKIPNHIKGLNGVVGYRIDSTKGMLNESIGSFEDSIKGVEEAFEVVNDEKMKAVDKILGKINTDVKAIKTNSKDALGDLGKKDTSKRVGKTKDKLNSMEKTLKRIKLISFIKLIRGAINSLIKGVESGISNLALFDSSFNDTMSELSTAKTQIFNSLGLIASPLIQIFQPIVTTLSNSLVNIANTVSLITAQIKGASTYTKINVDYMNDYAKSLQKAKGFAFDTFNALDTQDSMYETASVDDAEIEKTSEMYGIVSGFLETFEVLRDFIADALKTIGQFISENKGNIQMIVEQSLQFTRTFFDSGHLSQFGDLFSTIATDVFPFLVENAGLFLEMIEQTTNLLKPLALIFGNKVIVNLLKIIMTLLQPINDIMELILLPVLTEIIELIVTILEPILLVISKILEGISNILRPIFKEWLPYLFKYIGSLLASAIKTFSTLLAPFIDKLKNIEGVFNSIKEIVTDIVDGITSLDFDKIANGIQKAFFRVLKFLASWIDAILNFFVEGINAVIANDAVKEVVKMVSGGNVKWNGITWRSNIASQVPTYANGGMVGELWQMNEKGNPEMLYNPYNNGNTSVINIEQLASAFERAIINTGLLSAIEDGRVVYIDGKYVAQSRNFKNELNRTNPNLNIK